MLNDAKIKNIELPDGKKQLKLADGRGLYLLLLKSGKYWRMNYRFFGKQKTVSFGTYPTTSLKEARGKCDHAKKLLEQNIDPMQDKKKIKRQILIEVSGARFRDIAEEWFDKKSPEWVKKTAAHKRSELKNHVLPWLGDIKANDVEAMDILGVCRRLEDIGHREQAHRIKMLCGQIMRYGIATGRIKRDPTPDLKGALLPIKATHRPCLKVPKEVGALMRAIDAHQGTFIVHCALRLSPYLFLRPVELRSIEWSEVDFESNTITIPAHKMKMRQTHIVPLSTQAIAILRDIQTLTGHGTYVFPSARTMRRPMSDGAINAALRKLGYDTKNEHCAHGFRGMASTLLHEQGYNSDVIERQLAHKEGNAIKAAYNHARHLPERTTMMQEWADYLDKLKSISLVSSQKLLDIETSSLAQSLYK